MLKTFLLAATLAATLASSALAAPGDGGRPPVGDLDDSFAAEPSDGPPPFAERQHRRRAPSYGAGDRDQGAFSGGADDRAGDDLEPPDEQRRSRRAHRRRHRHDEPAPYWGGGAPYVGEWSYGQPQPHEPPPPSIPGVRNGLYYY